MPSITTIAPPKELIWWLSRLVRLPTISPPWIVTSAPRTTMAPPRSGEELLRNEELMNVALDPGSTLTAPPPVIRLAARLFRNEHWRNSASAAERVTPPDSLRRAL